MSFCGRHVLTYYQTHDFRLPAVEERYGNVIGGEVSRNPTSDDDGDDIRFGLGRPFELSAVMVCSDRKKRPTLFSQSLLPDCITY